MDQLHSFIHFAVLLVAMIGVVGAQNEARVIFDRLLFAPVIIIKEKI